MNEMESLFKQLQNAHQDTAKALFEETASKTIESKTRILDSYSKQKKFKPRTGTMYSQPEYIARKKAEKAWKESQRSLASDSDDSDYRGNDSKKRKVDDNMNTPKKNTRSTSSPKKKLWQKRF